MKIQTGRAVGFDWPTRTPTTLIVVDYGASRAHQSLPDAQHCRNPAHHVRFLCKEFDPFAGLAQLS